MKRALSAMRQNRQSEPKRGDTMPFDLMDREILSALRADGRLTMSELAEKVGLSQSLCWTRVKRLEAPRGDPGLRRSPRSQGDRRSSVVVFVEVTLDRHDEGMLEAFGSALAGDTGGRGGASRDRRIRLFGQGRPVAGTEHYERFLRESLYRIAGIRHTRSTFALRALKRAISVDPLLLG